MTQAVDAAQNPVWMLFENGELARVQLTLYPPVGESVKPADAYVITEGVGLTRSARRAAEVVFNWLHASGRKQKPFVAGFDLFGLSKGPVSGESGGLAFALALASSLTGADVPAVAATGEIASGHGDGQVVAIRGIEEKLKSAANVIQNGGMIFYPLANDGDISSGLREEISGKNIGLYGVASVSDALTVLFGTAESRSEGPKGAGKRKGKCFSFSVAALCLSLFFAGLAYYYFADSMADSRPAGIETMTTLVSSPVPAAEEKDSPALQLPDEKNEGAEEDTLTAKMPEETSEPGDKEKSTETSVLPESRLPNNRGFE